MTTIAAALKFAKTRVSTLYPAGHKQWAFNVWSPRHDGWFQGLGMPYRKAVTARRNAVVFEALVHLGVSQEEAFGWADMEDGSAADLVAKYLAAYPFT